MYYISVTMGVIGFLWSFYNMFLAFHFDRISPHYREELSGWVFVLIILWFFGATVGIIAALEWSDNKNFFILQALYSISLLINTIIMLYFFRTVKPELFKGLKTKAIYALKLLNTKVK